MSNSITITSNEAKAKREESREAKAREVKARIQEILGLLDAHKNGVLTLEREVINNLRHEYQTLTGTELKAPAIKVLKITSRHETLSQAVEASGMDLSYNPKEAKDNILNTERNPGARVKEAFVMEDGRVLYVYAVIRDIKLLNEFEPFHSMMHDGPFYGVRILENEIQILNTPMLRDRESRRKIAECGLIVTTLAA